MELAGDQSCCLCATPGLYTQGLYRKSAGTSSKNALRAALEEGVCRGSFSCVLWKGHLVCRTKHFLSALPDPETAVLETYSVHAVAAAVGGFFRELPEPLLTWDMYLEFIRAMGE